MTIEKLGVVDAGWMWELFCCSGKVGICRVRTGDYGEQRRGIGDGAGHGASDVVVGEEWDDAGAAGKADGGANADQVVMGGRPADGVAGVRAKTGLAKTGGDAGCCSAARPGRNACQVIGIASGSGDGTGGEIRAEGPL